MITTVQVEQMDSSPCTEIKARFEERYQKLLGQNDYPRGTQSRRTKEKE